LATSFVCKIYNHFEEVTDPRVNRGANHPLIEMIFLTLCASICDAEGWVDVERNGNAKLDWLRKFFPFENGIPSHDTLGRVFSRLDTLEFYAALQSWANEIAGSLRGQTIAVDGKTLRGSHDGANGKSALHSISAWACGLRMCIGLNSVDDESNEIPAAQELIRLLDLQGAVVTADAMHCQTETAKAIVSKDADYILTVKGNQPALQEVLNTTLLKAMDNEDPKLRRCQSGETTRRRAEIREVVVLPAPKHCSVLAGWEGIKTIGLIYRSREINGQVQESTETFISSLAPKVRDHAKRIREHWGIENKQHWILDVTFSEDSSRIRKGSSPEISSVFRRLALSILQRDTTIKDNIRGKRKRCSWDNSMIERLIKHFSSI
jgi:predicted transposase YbfD/YdcC